MFKIGLDLSIYAHLKNKKTGIESTIEIAYWRKAYAIRNMLVDVANKHLIHHPENFADVQLHCRTIAIDEIIENLIRELTDIDSPYWTDSIFDAEETRETTLTNLNHLLIFKDWLVGKCETDYMLAHCFELYDTSDCEERNQYEVCLEILNSY